MKIIFNNVYRRTKIKQNWKFDCDCTRCKDATELGTNLDAVLCMKCRRGREMYNITKASNADEIPKVGSEKENDLSDKNLVKGLSSTLQSVKKEPYMLPKDSLEYYGQWVCNHCNAEVDGFTIYSLVKELQSEVEAMNGMII